MSRKKIEQRNHLFLGITFCIIFYNEIRNVKFLFFQKMSKIYLLFLVYSFISFRDYM